jgi:uncharacterized protein with HEPN domain
MERDSSALLDIYTAANRILDFTAGINLDTFINVVETHSAVLYQFIVIGEATGRLSEEFRAQHPVAPWRRMVGLRNILTHRYEVVDLEEVWNIVQHDLPALVDGSRAAPALHSLLILVSQTYRRLPMVSLASTAAQLLRENCRHIYSLGDVGVTPAL